MLQPRTADRNPFTTVGDVVPSDINMRVSSDMVRIQGCTELASGKGFVVTLGTS